MTNNLEKDLIIIGAGLNGLSAGIAYALNNDLRHKSVLIVEKNPYCGGYMTTFTRKGFQFDTCQMISNVSNILDYFGIKVDSHEFTHDFVRIFKVVPQTGGVMIFDLFSGENTFEEQFYRLFPSEAEKLKKLFNYSEAMFREIYCLKYKPGFFEILKMLITCPRVIHNMNKTFSQYLEMFGINNPEINLMFQVFSGMCGLPNDRVAALLTVGVIYSLREKAYRPRGQFSELPKKLGQRFQELGGDLLLKSEVNKILIEKGAVRGVRLTDGSIIHSRNVISTIDVKTTLAKLIGSDILRSLSPKYARKIESTEMTTSAFTVNLGIDDAAILTHARLPAGYSLLTSGNNAFSTLFSAFEKNEFKVSEECFFIGLSCPPPQEREKPVLTIQSIPNPMSNWIDLRNTDRKRYIQEKEKTADLLINIVEKYLVPDLKQHIIVRDISTPATFARYSGSPGGSIYDMASVPSNFGASRLPVVTPVRGLLLPKFAHGAFGAMNSGLQAIDVLLNGKVLHGNSRFGITR